MLLVYPEWVKHENRCSQLRMQEALCYLSWSGTISGMVLGMERSWHSVLMSEGIKAGQRSVLPHTSPARSGDEPQLYDDCMHWT